MQATSSRSVGLRDILLVLWAPGRVFARTEDVPAYGWPLVVLLTSVTVIGYATVQTGLISREVDRQVRERIAVIESQQRDVVERSALREMYKKEYQKGEFEKLLARIQVVVAEPIKALASTLLIAAVLYGAVAMTGHKPEWQTLLTICVFAGFVWVLRSLLVLLLMLKFRTLEVDTSLALLARVFAGGEKADPVTVAALSGGLSAIDPFRAWYWLVVILGMSVTTQLRGWRAWGVCVLCWLATAGARAALAVALVLRAAGSGPAGGA
jgi:hypothetical protein